MFDYKIPFVIIVVLISCKNSASHQENPSDSDSSNLNIKSAKVGSEDTIGFFSNCQKLVNHSALGSLQGVEASSDSLRSLYFGDCFDYCPETFQIIFVHKDFTMRANENYDSLSREFRNGCSDYFKNFDCFAFVCPRRDPDKQEDIHALNIDFPVAMQIYERLVDDNWKFIEKVTAKTYEEYALIRFKTIYRLR